jgi:lauroyl/myristoyl acyltransferase
MMLIAIVLITIGSAKAKRQTDDSQKYKKLAIWFGIALVLILAAIPWPFRAEIGKSLFPGM